MSMTMTQKILAAHAGLLKVEAGQLILVDVDRVLGNDITSPVAIREFERIGAKEVYDKEKVLEKALEIQKKIDSGEITGPLAGVPVAIKDNMCTKDMLTTCSSKILYNFVIFIELPPNSKKLSSIFILFIFKTLHQASLRKA